MGSYVPGSGNDRKEMLAECGLSDFAGLYKDIPEKVKLTSPLDLPEGGSELAVRRTMEALAGKNRSFKTILRGAGAYDHYIPEIVNEVTGRREFLTAYTPYQPEISQGILQSIFEYQTEICELTGMDASNASVYDGASAAAEACEMLRDRKRQAVVVSGSVDPEILSVVKTYAFGRGSEVRVVPARDGRTDIDAVKAAAGDAACVLIQQPNYYGIIEDATLIADAVHEAGAGLVMSVNPISLALLKTPGECGADVAVGEGQPLGIPLSSGGPYIGFMAARGKLMRKLPGRIVGETTDHDGRRGFVLTLQAREQHIRREKASSNICSNEALCAMRVNVYLSAMGRAGLEDAAKQCVSKAHYLKDALVAAGHTMRYDAPFFHEFVTECKDPEKLLKALADEGILGGLPLGDGGILWCCTEKNTREELDLTARIAGEVEKV